MSSIRFVSSPTTDSDELPVHVIKTQQEKDVTTWVPAMIKKGGSHHNYRFTLNCYAAHENYNATKVMRMMLTGGIAMSRSDFFLVAIDSTHKVSPSPLLNSSYKRALDLGIGMGMQECLLPSDWKIIGYDYSKSAIDYLRTNKKEIESRLIDLNNVDPVSKVPAYRSTLAEDLAEVTNIIAIESIQFMEDDALEGLLLSLMTLTKPGSVFFFVTRILNDQPPSKTLESEKKEEAIVVPKTKINADGIPAHDNIKKANRYNYIPSFFTSREDMEVIKNSFTAFSPEEVAQRRMTGGTQFFVARKKVLAKPAGVAPELKEAKLVASI